MPSKRLSVSLSTQKIETDESGSWRTNLVIGRKKMTGARISLVVGLVLAATALFDAEAFAASVRVKQYLHPKPEFEALNKLFLDGAKDGLIASNEALISENKQPLFCIPMNLALTTDQTHDIVVRWIEKQSIKYDDNAPIAIVLLDALQDMFPCKR